MKNVPTVRDVAALIEELAPLDLRADWDNVGLQLGEESTPVRKALVTLTVTPDIAALAAAEGVQLIVAHHPLIFRPLRQIRTDTPQGALVASLLRHGTAVYVSHTNLDSAAYGLNHWLAERLELGNPRPLVPGLSPGTGLGRVGRIQPMSAADFAAFVGRKLQTPVRLIGQGSQMCAAAAVCGGSGGSLIEAARAAGAHVLVTGDVSYHDALEALDAGLAVIDAGHHGTEKIMVPKLAEYLRSRLAGQLEVLEAPSLDPFAG